MEDLDVAIIGGGPAGLQAALVLSRTRKHVVVFDDPEPPRNAASRGVHNFVGLDGLLPQEIRDHAWSQIDRYDTARLERTFVTRIDRPDPAGDFVVSAEWGSWRARHVMLTCGYHDVHPDIDGFAACWGYTIIPCPFCDGWENRDRVWGIVPSMPMELDVFPMMVQNWTSKRLVIAPQHLAVSDAHQQALAEAGVPLFRGDIASITHSEGAVTGVTLDNGQSIEVETLLWSPEERLAPLVTQLVDELGLALDDNGHVAVDNMQRTNIDRLWAAGDVQGWQGAIEAATLANMASTMIVHGWYQDATPAP